MAFRNSLSQLIKDHSTRNIVGAVLTLLIVIGLVLAIILAIRYRNRKVEKKTNFKNTIELNEE